MTCIQCINCGDRLTPFIKKIKDFEYGVEWESCLVRCPNCGLVTHDPPVNADQIPALYPPDYLATGTSSKSPGVYGFLKSILADRAIKRLSSLIPNNGSFVEVGCGNGHLLKRLEAHRKDIHFTGVDIVEVHDIQMHNFIFYKGQFEYADLPEKSADVIYCSNLIEHVAQPLLFLEQCIRVLKPGGQIYGITPNHDSIDRRIFGRRWGGYHYPRHTYIFNDKNIKEIIRRVGFVRPKTSGSYSFWYISLSNILMPGHGRKKRGILFALVSAATLPLDMIINLFTCHGSMVFTAEASEKKTREE